MFYKALRVFGADVLYKFRPFVRDLFQQIRNESISDSIVVYLGITIQRDDFDGLQKHILK